VADERESVVFRRRLCANPDVGCALAPDRDQMAERFAVVFRVDSSQTAGARVVDDDRLSLPDCSATYRWIESEEQVRR
jgi:hypothetical protein